MFQDAAASASGIQALCNMDLYGKHLISGWQINNHVDINALEAGGYLIHQCCVIQDPMITDNHCLKHSHYLRRHQYDCINILLIFLGVEISEGYHWLDLLQNSRLIVSKFHKNYPGPIILSSLVPSLMAG